LKDKEALEELLMELVSFNNGLESLLPRRDTIFISQGLMGEIVQLLIELQKSKNNHKHLSSQIKGSLELWTSAD